MSTRIRVTLKKPNNPNRRRHYIQLVLSASFKEIDANTDRCIYRQLKVSIGSSIKPSYWDFENQRPTSSYSEKDKGHLHGQIDWYIKQLELAYVQLINSEHFEEITPKDVRNRYEHLIGSKRTTVVQSGVSEFISYYAATSRKEKESTKQKYTLLANRIERFEREMDIRVSWNSFNADIYEGLLEWMRLQYSLSDNSMAQVEKVLIKFRHLARKKGLIKSDLNWVSLYKYQQQDQLYLSWEDIRKIVEFKPDSEAHINVRKLIIILAFTGIRVSDIEAFIENISDAFPTPVSEFKLSKSPNPSVCIPLLEPLRQELKMGLPYLISKPRLNALIKLVCAQIFGYDVGIQISAHTFRHSFITNTLSAGMRSWNIAALSGHKLVSSRKVFFSYNRLSERENAIVFLKHLALVPPEETGGMKLTRFTEGVFEN